MQPLYSPGGVYLGDFHAIPLDSKRVNGISSTIVRGLYRKLRGQRFPDGYTFTIERYDPVGAKELFDSMKRHGASGPYVLGTVFACLCMVALEDPGVTAWLMQFYSGMF